EQLEQAGEAAELGRRHALFFLARAEAAEPFLPVHAEGWQERLVEDIGNLRAAADWFEQDPTAVDDNLRFAAALHWFWFALGQSRLLDGDLERAASVLAEALSVARAGQPRYWITYALYWQGRVAQAQGDLAAARAAFDEGVTQALEEGFNAPIAHLATIRGRLALAEGESNAALGWFAVALPPLKRTKNHWSAIILVEDLARIAADRGDAQQAARLLGAVANLREEAGAAPLPLEREILDRLDASLRASLGAAAYEAAFQAGQALSLSSALDLAESMVGQPAPAVRPAGGPVLRVNALGPLEMAVDGQRLPVAAWSSAQPRELLL